MTVQIIDTEGKPIPAATVAKLNGVAVVESWILDTRPVALGVTDAHGEIRLGCDPSRRSAFLAQASGKAPRLFGFWGCVPPEYRLTLQQSRGTFSGRIMDAGGKAQANAWLRIRVVRYELLLPVRPFVADYPAISYDLSARTDADGRFNLPAPLEGSVESVDVKQNGIWHSTTQPGLDAASEALKDGSFVGRTDPAAIEASVPPVAMPTTMPTLAIHLRVFDASTNRPIENIRVIPGGCSFPDQLFHTLWPYRLASPWK